MHEIPEFLYKKIEETYDKNTDKIIKGYNSKKILSLRVNISKKDILEIEEELQKNNIEYEKVSWYDSAIIVKNEKEAAIKNLNMYKNGEIYLQSLSSMIPPLILNPIEGQSILDMAAAPGGKTTQMANLSNNKALIMACEKNKIRAERLKYNIKKQSAKKITVVEKDARKLDEFFKFDKILLDSPCSGSGTLNVYSNNFDIDLINRSVKFQKELLKKGLSMLKKDGELVYSTCSILKEENEDIIKDVINNEFQIVPIEKNKFKDIPLLPVTIDGTICICPSEFYEGFFIAKIRRIK